MSETITRLKLDDTEFIIIGTAHVSSESVEEVKQVINDEAPDRVCVEIDESRYRSLTQKQNWSSMNVSRVLKERKGFFLLAQLALASFQRRIGADLGVKPGEEMLAAIVTAEELGIATSFCDREIQITLKRAWSRSGLWNRNKMLAALLSSIFTKEKLSEKDIEALKKTNALQSMLEELAEYLPSVKEVLIDERDTYLADRIYQAEGSKKVVVLGAGHVPGVVERLKSLHGASARADTGELTSIPSRSFLARSLKWLLPAAIIGAIIAGFFLRGTDVTRSNLIKWVLINGTLSAFGSLIVLAHPLTILLAFVAAPFTSLVPVIGVGIFTGILETALRKPRVLDFEQLNDDLASVKGFFRNRFTHILLVFFFSSLGSSIGTFIGGIPLFTSLFG